MGDHDFAGFSKNDELTGGDDDGRSRPEALDADPLGRIATLTFNCDQELTHPGRRKRKGSDIRKNAKAGRKPS
jgi:hypothetical protein